MGLDNCGCALDLLNVQARGQNSQSERHFCFVLTRKDKMCCLHAGP